MSGAFQSNFQSNFQQTGFANPIYILRLLRSAFERRILRRW